MIMQRPLLVTDDKAIIGRPKERVRELLSTAETAQAAGWKTSTNSTRPLSSVVTPPFDGLAMP